MAKEKMTPAVEEEAVAQATELTTQSTALAPADDYSEYAGAGFEGLEADELQVPFFRLLQTNSPDLDPTSPIYKEHARPGMILNTLTEELIDGRTGFMFLPVRRDHLYLEKAPIEAGGGMVSVWSPSDPRIGPLKDRQGKFGRLKLESGNELIEVRSLYGLGTTEAGTIEGIISFSSTQMKKYASIVSKANQLIRVGADPKKWLPLFAYQWQLGSQPESNKKGKFFGWRVSLVGGNPNTARVPADSELFARAASFFKMLRAGKASADFATDHADAATTEDEEIPF